MTQVKLTDRYVDGLENAQKQYTVSDTTEGLFVVVGPKSKTWTVRVNATDPMTGKSRPYKKTLGKFPAMSVRAARSAAGAAREELRQTGPEGRAEEITLLAAWEALREKLETEVAVGKRSPRTIDGYAYGMQLAEPFHRALLPRLTRSRKEVHDHAYKIMRERGQGVFNSFVKTLRRVYRHAAILDNDLDPTPPTFGLEVETLERDRAIGPDEFKDWIKKLDRIESGVKRTFWWF